MHFPLFQIHPISETFFGLSGKFSQFDLCRKKLLIFYPPKFLTTTFV